MSTKIRVAFGWGNNAEVVNASRERIEVKFADWPGWALIQPNTRFTGNLRNSKVEVLPPIVPEATKSVEYPHPVRRATEDDIDALCLMVPRLLEETNLLPVSATKIQRLIERCAMREGGAIAGIIDGPDGIDASVGLDVAESDISDHRFIRSIWLGIHPDLRENPPGHGDQRANHGRRLFDFARWYHAKLEQSAGHPILMQFDVATRVELGPKLGLYERNALPVGASFAYLSSGSFLAHDVAAVA
jgi:hypothetical protein